MFKLTFRYTDRTYDVSETTVWGATKEQAYTKAYQRSAQSGDGEIVVVSLYDMKVKA